MQPENPLNPSVSVTPPPASRRRSRLLVSVGSFVTVGLVGLGAAAIAFGSGGASSPEEAVRHLADAVGEQDVLAAVATLAPDETRSLPDVVGAMSAKAKELDISGRFERAIAAERAANPDDSPATTAARASTDNPLEGIDLTVSDLRLETKQLSDDVAEVQVVGGTLTWKLPEAATTVGPRYLPFGLLSGRLSDIGYEARDSSSSTDGSSTDESEADRHGTVDFGKLHRRATDDEPGVFAMTVQRDGGWYVSPLFTAAEYFRITAGAAPVASYDVDPGPAADSPTHAVTALVDAAASGDSSAVANVLASELSVWRVYHDTATDENHGTDPAFDDASSVTVGGLETHETPIDDERVRVVIDRATVRWTESRIDWDHVPDSYYEEEDVDESTLPKISVHHTLTVDGDCFTESSDSSDDADHEPVCLSTTEGGIIKALGVDRIAMVAVADRDGWAISPIETVADYLHTVVDHVTGPLFDRMTGWADGAGTPTDGALDPGDNSVRLDDAGRAVLRLDLPDATFATVTTPDADTAIDIDGYGTLASPGRHTVVVTGRIGDERAAVTVHTVEAEPLDSSAGPVTGRIEPGTVRAFRLTAAQYANLSITTGYEVTQSTYDADGNEWYPYDGADATPPDDTVYVVIEPAVPVGDRADTSGHVAPVEWQFTLAFAPETGGFAAADPTVTTFDALNDSAPRLGVVAGRPFTLTVESSADATMSLSCSSGQFEGGDDPVAEIVSSDHPVVAGTPATVTLTPTTSEICDVRVSVDDATVYMDGAPDDPSLSDPSLPDSVPVTIRWSTA